MLQGDMQLIFRLIQRLLSFCLTLLLFLPILVVLAFIFPQYSFVPIGEHWLEEKTHFPCNIETASLNVLKGAFEINRVSLNNSVSYPTSNFLTLKDLQVEVDPLALKEGKYIFNKIIVDIDTLTWVKDKDGIVNFMDFTALIKNVDLHEEGFVYFNNLPKLESKGDSQVVIKELVLKINRIGVVDYSKHPFKRKSFVVGYSRTFTDLTQNSEQFVSVEKYSLDNAFKLIVKDFVKSGFYNVVVDSLRSLTIFDTLNPACNELIEYAFELNLKKRAKQPSFQGSQL